MDNIEKLTLDIKNMFNKGIIKNRLSQVKIHNLRKFTEDSELNFNFPLTVIVGKNGSGKTTVMKAMKLLSTSMIPKDEFFETAIDNGGFANANISYMLDGKILQYKRLNENHWEKEGEMPENLFVTYIQPKSMVGAIDKSFLYDDIGKNTSRTQKVEYVIKQSRKIMQNSNNVSARKRSRYLNQKALNNINYILQENIKSIEIVKHKYYSGTWGTSIIFNDCAQYSEYNSGSGEFVVASIVDQIERVSSNSILLLDEPEISLHPGAQRRLIYYILETIKQKNFKLLLLHIQQAL